jgi:hypothetical protein
MTTNHIPSAAIAGLHRRYDVATKCHIVKLVLSITYPDKATQNNDIDKLALLYDINPITIKVWCAKYASTFEQGIKLPAGVMSFVATPIHGKEIAVVEAKLKDLRDKALVIKRKYHPETGSTPREILDELILDKEQ